MSEKKFYVAMAFILALALAVVFYDAATETTHPPSHVSDDQGLRINP